MRIAVQVVTRAKLLGSPTSIALAIVAMGGTGIVLACLQVLIEDMALRLLLAIKRLMGNPIFFPNNPAVIFPKFPLGTTNHSISRFSGTLQLGVSIEIIECLQAGSGLH